jgi:ketosteroid isomerase-like protein
VTEKELEHLRARVQQLRDVEEIKQLRARYVRLVDTKDWAAWARLLSDDFRLESDAGVHEGRDAVVAMVSAALSAGSTVHHCFTPEIVITGGDAATGTWAMEDIVRIEVDGTPVAFHGYGHYRDEYVRTADGWRFRSSVETRLQIDPLD